MKNQAQRRTVQRKSERKIERKKDIIKLIKECLKIHKNVNIERKE